MSVWVPSPPQAERDRVRWKDSGRSPSILTIPRLQATMGQGRWAGKTPTNDRPRSMSRVQAEETDSGAPPSLRVEIAVYAAGMFANSASNILSVIVPLWLVVL